MKTKLKKFLRENKMSSNENLPEGVGKKIVEALKKQQELDNQTNNIELDNNDNEDTAVENKSINDAIEPITTSQNIEESSFKPSSGQMATIDDIIDNKNEAILDKMNREPQVNILKEPIQTGWDYNATFEHANDVNNDFSDKTTFGKGNGKMPPVKEFELPSNVSVLKNLIKQLPTGVTKQTGAQIIRQTLEALGISMTSVLSEAQSVQDELNDAIRDCMSTIEEYKINMQTLERQAMEYQKQVSNINDLVSLFILTDQK